MEIYHTQSEEVSVTWNSEEEKQRWIEEHAHQLQHVFDQWQKPLGIDGEEYYKYLIKEIADHCHEPLMKYLVETLK